MAFAGDRMRARLTERALAANANRLGEGLEFRLR